MTADIIPFPTPPSYLAYCNNPEQRDAANAIFELFAEEMSKASAERITRNMLKRLEEAAG